MTFLVLEALRNSDDFMDMAMLVKFTGCSAASIHSALYWLRKCRCVDVVVNADGHGWHYARPAEEDNRSKHFDLRTPEKNGRKPKRKLTRKENA